MRFWHLLRTAVLVVLTFVVSACPHINLAFMTTIDIRNDSGVDVWITPLGSSEHSDFFRALPRYDGPTGTSRYSSQQSRILLRAGSTVAYSYDMDDFNFRFILLRTEKGVLKMLPTDFTDRLTQVCCFGAKQTVYVIPSLRGLPSAPAGVELVEAGKRVSSELFAALYPSR